jgi:hypothetical protein
MLHLMVQAFKSLHRNNGKALESDLTTISGADGRADAFYKCFKATDVSKGNFAQELSLLLESSSLAREDVPSYILSVFEFLGVIEAGGSDGSADSQSSDSVANASAN